MCIRDSNREIRLFTLICRYSPAYRWQTIIDFPSFRLFVIPTVCTDWPLKRLFLGSHESGRKRCFNGRDGTLWTGKSSFYSVHYVYHSGDKSQGLRRSPKGLTFTFGFVGRAVSYPKHDREIRLFTSICRDSPAYQGQTIIFTLPPLCSITLWRVYINHRNINYLFPPDFRGR